MSGPVIVDVEIIDIVLPLREHLVAAHGRIGTRPIALVRLGDGEHDGWGECDALADATYSGEDATGASRTLRERLLPSVRGLPVEMAAIDSALTAVVGQPMARAAVTMAARDLLLRRAGSSLADSWAVAGRTVAAGAVVGLAETDDLLARVASLVGEGYGRVKLKVQPGHDVEVVAAVRGAFPDLELHVDANGSYRSADPAALHRLDALGVRCIEQPFGIGEEAASAALDARLTATVALDESVTTMRDLDHLLAVGFGGSVVVKPARLGGLDEAKSMHDRCVGEGLGVVAGGMLESAFGRRALTVLAALPGFDLTGDVSPSSRWFHDDIAPDLVMSGGRVAVPTGPGVGPAPERAALDRLRA